MTLSKVNIYMYFIIDLLSQVVRQWDVSSLGAIALTTLAPSCNGHTHCFVLNFNLVCFFLLRLLIFSVGAQKSSRTLPVTIIFFAINVLDLLKYLLQLYLCVLFFDNLNNCHYVRKFCSWDLYSMISKFCCNKSLFRQYLWCDGEI